MPIRTSEATWEGRLRDGEGHFVVGDNVLEGEYTFTSRFEEGEEGKTNPEELVGAAHAACFSMKFAADLEAADYDPQRVHTVADVDLGDGKIDAIELTTEADVPGVDEEEFQEIAEDSKRNCPISKTLAEGPEITLDATLV